MPGKYTSDTKDFLTTENETVLGHLAIGVTNHQLLIQQRTSWNHQITYLKENFQHLPSGWFLILEYPIPRRAKRIDAVLLARDLIFVIKFKDKETKYSPDAISQVEDYSLDIQDFHKQSATRTIVPIVWASEARDVNNFFSDNGDFVKPTLFTNRQNLHSTIKKAFEYFTNTSSNSIDPIEWNNSEYLPTPTIIEAAQHLFAGQNVREISRSQPVRRI